MGFPLVKLSEICEINIGKTPARANDLYWGKGSLWLSIADMNQGRYIKYTSEQITELAIKETKIKKTAKGTLLYSFKLSIGKIGVAETDLYTNEAIASLPIKDSRVILTDYLYYALSQLDSNNKVDRAVMGATLNKEKLAELQIPLPPLPIQRHIARVLDQADQLRKQAQQMETELNQLAQAVFLEMFGDPVTNPKGWAVKPLKDFALIQIGPFGTQLHKEDYIQGGIPLINPMHINNHKINPQNEFTISKKKHSEMPEYHLKKGDVIMGRRGEMGRCALVTEHEQGWLCGTGCLFIRTEKGEVFGSYLQKFLSSDYIKSYLESEAKGATMPNLNKTIIGDISVPLPNDLALNKFEQIKLKIEELAKTNTIIEMDTLFHSLVQKAFKGELIPTTMEHAA